MSPRGAKRLPGFALTAPTRRKLTGRICDAIHAGPMPAMPVVASLFSPPRWSRRRHSRSWTTTCRRPRPRKSSTSTARCLCSAIRSSTLRRHRRRRCFSCQRRHRISSSWSRRRHRSGCSSCRSHSLCRSRFTSSNRSMSCRRQTTSFSPTSTTRPSSIPSSTGQLRRLLRGSAMVDPTPRVVLRHRCRQP